MKKVLCLMLIMLVLVTGCGNKEVSKNNSNSLSNDEVQSTEPTTVTPDESITENGEQAPTTTKKTTKSTTTKKTTKSTTAEAKKTYGKNMYKTISTGKINKYTYTYADEATCKKRGDDHFDDINPTHPYVAFGCEQIEDENGNKLWGVFYYKTADDSSKFYY